MQTKNKYGRGTKSCLPGLILYELKNIAGNPFTLFFGVGFPIILTFIITGGLALEITDPEIYALACTDVFITITPVIPLAVVLLGYSANYSQELEKEIPLRMNLFGFSQKNILLSKIIAQLIAMTLGLAIYGITDGLLLQLVTPTAGGLFLLLLCLYLLGIVLFVFAHGISSLLKKFGPTYCVVMLLYFGIMALCGMMGLSTDKYPPAVQAVSNMLPVTYICNDFTEVWQGNSYNFMPLIQSFLFVGALSLILLLYAVHRDRRKTGRK